MKGLLYRNMFALIKIYVVRSDYALVNEVNIALMLPHFRLLGNNYGLFQSIHPSCFSVALF